MNINSIKPKYNQQFTPLFSQKNKNYSYVLEKKFPFIKKKYHEVIPPSGIYAKAEIRCPIKISPNFADKIKNYTKRKQKLPEDVYFIKMEQYGKNKEWAKEMENLTYMVSYLISQKTPFEELMSTIEKEVNRINRYSNFGSKRLENDYFQICEIGRGSEYFDKYLNEMYENRNKKIEPKATKEYIDAKTAIIRWDKRCSCVEVSYGAIEEDSPNLNYISNLYNKLLQSKDLSEKQISDIVAKIHWLFAQQTPYQRGNDSIANLLTKSIYHAYDVEISPIRKNISLDFEAFHRDEKDFVEKYASFFEKHPKKIN